jgi:predicted TIM-barrel fold metal-dependent hydrolase
MQLLKTKDMAFRPATARRRNFRAVCMSGCILLTTLLVGSSAGAQQAIDTSLLAFINGIKAIDNHAHPLLPAIAGMPADADYDALPLLGIPEFPMPAGLDPANPRWIAAWRALYGYRFDDAGGVHAADLKQAKATLARQQGDGAANWALDRMGTDVMLANRVSMGHGLQAPRFRWVSFVDPLLFPLDVSGEAAATPDVAVLYPREAQLLHRYLGDIHATALPKTLDQYLTEVVNATLDRMKNGGAVAVKFELAYLRPLNIGNPGHDSAAAIYAHYVLGGTPTHAEYTTLEDFLFRAIAREAGLRGLPVHIHCLGFFGGFYPAAGSQPLELESVFNDPTLRGTRFVLLHGGWPYADQTLALLEKPNVYADISSMTQILSPHTLAEVLRRWIEEFPDKVLYGSDAAADHNDDPVGWPEQGWVAAGAARRALAMALTEMMNDGMVSRTRAQQISQQVMRDNARTLYNLGAVDAQAGRHEPRE